METYTPTVECCAGPFRRQYVYCPGVYCQRVAPFRRQYVGWRVLSTGWIVFRRPYAFFWRVTSTLDVFVDGTYVGLCIVNVLNLLIGSTSVGVYSQRAMYIPLLIRCVSSVRRQYVYWRVVSVEFFVDSTYICV